MVIVDSKDIINCRTLAFVSSLLAVSFTCGTLTCFDFEIGMTSYNLYPFKWNFWLRLWSLDDKRVTYLVTESHAHRSHAPGLYLRSEKCSNVRLASFRGSGLCPLNSNSAEIFVQWTYLPSFTILCLIVRKLSCSQTYEQTKQKDLVENIYLSFASIRRWSK